MVVGGLQKLTLLDYPDHLAAIVFTFGCNFRCHFCYNPQLVVPQRSGVKNKSSALSLSVSSGNKALDRSHSEIDADGFFEFLRSRQGKLDAVVITGGEPTLHADLPDFIKRIKNLGFLVKLDTNGTNPEMLASLIKNKLVDYIAMDLKAPLHKYAEVTGVKVSLEKIKKSIIIVMRSGLPYEFRSTIMPVFHQEADIRTMGELIKGAAKWYLQKFQPNHDLVDNNFKWHNAYTDKEMLKLQQIAANYVQFCGLR